ncbi:MAG: hypothetical protein ACI91T_002791 [Natronomonas sp.]|jgi:hypothetical protein
MANVTIEEAGKRVVDANGDHLGTVERVEGGTPFVDPNEDISTMTAVVLGWADEEGSYPLGTHHIESISEEAIHLESNL